MVTQIELPDLTKKELILTLIKADMRNVKLIYGLENAGALVENFYSNLNVIVLKLIGFEETERKDELYALYDKKMAALIDLHVTDFIDGINYLALDFYNELLLQKIKLNCGINAE
ncbi:hypothetical protein [Cytophaga hutchinsonii]|uniref:Uncharacterized protein n=1 Tax=Cytophaga hutchinsonii (strain ATCC 33406 / DSM 1761 / CIP 103989 / NBRC 15051 / NCIMB 9469 / D465) TaxID=269798 RepID=A0A6N4SUV9_CYTH3|nr:hypothetical protein [Cytophaga hutchinsonii]ABG60175.1 hypothetical protein CHU_2933 [Cytophaga hutchinsonii ATCC 33406]SFX22639.1 hypothetical protein SAMN04487930_102128 [Cytophaga hutchinsonii ATCC 33406]